MLDIAFGPRREPGDLQKHERHRAKPQRDGKRGSRRLEKGRNVYPGYKPRVVRHKYEHEQRTQKEQVFSRVFFAQKIGEKPVKVLHRVFKQILEEPRLFPQVSRRQKADERRRGDHRKHGDDLGGYVEYPEYFNDRVRYLTHLSDWVMGEIVEVENNPYRGTIIAAKDSLGRIYWGEKDYFNPIIDDQEGEKLKDIICERIRQLETGEVKAISNEQVFAEIQNRYGF